MIVINTAAANKDIRKIYFYYAARSPQAAARIVAKINQSFELLSRHPRVGRARSRFGRAVRGIVSGNYVILYMIDENRVTILRVIDGRMDIETEFKR